MTDELPHVPLQHEVARAASRWIEFLLPAAWVVHTPSEGDDYGVDLRIEVVENGSITGRQVVVQVKGTAAPSEISRVRLKRTTVSYLRELSDPAIVLRVCPDSRQIRLMSAHDHRLDAEPDGWTHLQDIDAVEPEDLPVAINRISCRNAIEQGRAPLEVGLDNDVAVRRVTLIFEGRLDCLMIFNTHSNSPWQQYSCRHIESSNIIRLQNLLPPRQYLDIPLTISTTGMISAHVSFLWHIGLGWVGARMLLRSAPLLGNTLLNIDHLIRCTATHLTHEECSTILRAGIVANNWWPAYWMTVLLKSGVGLHLTKDEIEHAFALQEKRGRFPMLQVHKAQALLAIGQFDAASASADQALLANEDRTSLLYYELSDVFARCGRVEDCIKLLEEAQTRSSKPETFGLDLAKYLVMLNRYTEAIELLATFDEPQGDPLRSLYRLSLWLAKMAQEATAEPANSRLSTAWNKTRAAFLQRTDPRAWASAAIALELFDNSEKDRISNALFCYSAIFFGGDVTRLVLEHPIAESLSSDTTRNLGQLAMQLDVWRGRMVVLSWNESEQELELTTITPTTDERAKSSAVER